MKSLEKEMTKKDVQQPKENPNGGMAKKLPDASIALDVATVLLNQPNGIEVINQAFEKTKDPATVVSMIITKIMEGVVDTLEQKGVDIDPSVWLMTGGVVDGMVEEIDRLANMGGHDVPDELKEDILDAVVQNLEAQMQGVEAQSQQPQQQAGPPQPQQGGQPPVPQGPPPPNMGGIQ